MQTDPPPRSSHPHFSLHEALGAHFEPYRHVTVPAEYADPEAEERALDAGCALFDRAFCDRLVLTGADRARFLHGQATCDVKDLAPGAGTFGLLTTLKGRVEVEMTVLVLEDRLLLDLPPGQGEPVESRLAKYVIADDVAFDGHDRAPLSLLGPEAETVLSSLVDGDLPGDAFRHLPATIGGSEVRVVREQSLGLTPVFSVWAGPEDAEAVVSALADAGAVPVGWRAFERKRVEAGRPLWGVDFGLDAFPQEAIPPGSAMEAAVNYAKGCYLGQEVVARIHYRGGVKRHMRGLVFDRPVEGAGAVLRLDVKEVGRATSVARSRRFGRTLGLGIVHDRAEPGASVEVLDGGTVVAHALVVELPFDPHDLAPDAELFQGR